MKLLLSRLEAIFKNAHREENFKLKSNAFEKYEYEHLGGW